MRPVSRYARLSIYEPLVSCGLWFACARPSTLLLIHGGNKTTPSVDLPTAPQRRTDTDLSASSINEQAAQLLGFFECCRSLPVSLVLTAGRAMDTRATTAKVAESLAAFPAVGLDAG